MSNFRPSNIPYPGPVWQPSVDYVPVDELARLKASPDATRIVWERAVPDPTYDAQAGASDFAGGHGQWLRIEQPGEHWAIVSGRQNLLRRFFPQGDWEQGTVAVQFDASVTPLSLFDRISVIGQSDDEAGKPYAVSYTQKETVVRGGRTQPAAGLITCLGVAVTGSGTAFLSLFQEGDILSAAGKEFVVASVLSDTSLTLAAAPPPYQFMPFGKSTDPLLYPPATSLQYAATGVQAYQPNLDVSLTPKGDALQWHSAQFSPLPGTRISVIYSYLPKYQITDMGVRPPVVSGKQGLSTVTATLVKPEQLGAFSS